MNNQLIKLLAQFMFGKTTPEKFKQLRSTVNDCSDFDIQSAMKTLWEDNRTPAPVPADTNKRVMKKLNEYAHPVPSYNLRWLKIASIILLPLFVTWGPYWYVSKNTPVADMVIMTDSGQKTHIMLPDGSKVWLNSKSSLSYPANFGIKNRAVRLVGEGYFEVAKNETKTFSVETKGVNVVVHGTRFNVAAHLNNPTTLISLIEGSVSVRDKKEQTLASLIPNQTLKIDNQSMQFDIIQEDTHLTALWSENKCWVENASADEVFKKLGYWYGLNIHLENKNTNYRYGFTIKEESFREFLELINQLTPLEYSINGEEVTIRYK